jgi:hypothetical protein
VNCHPDLQANVYVAVCPLCGLEGFSRAIGVVESSFPVLVSPSEPLTISIPIVMN